MNGSTTAQHSEPEPLAAVLAALELDQTGDDTFVGSSLPQLHGRVYGGQVLAQALLAAGRTVSEGRLPHSVHGYFLRPGALDEPITFAVERLRDGRSFSARRTHALQSGVPILSMITSFQEEQVGLEHADEMPDVPAPESLPSSVELFNSLDHPVAQFFYRNGAFDLRHTAGNLFTGPAAEPTDHQFLWMRSRAPIPGDQLQQRALLAYACDQVMLEPIMRRHGLSWMTPEASVASLDHAMWWHRDVDAGEWLLYAQSSPSARGGRGLGAAKVFSRDGELVATIAQEGMVRVPQARN
ncbi:acyl-CoA thioesterase [Ruania halotolerans]|uniref:acyl-CoA thioesterase n=1 Tax=Ruania halotolerans TaxID=2897773 RepID=UPI001E62ED63|nr:acyl-CoA thioesterase II [Ruania halotolerans]UFU05311.1 acyl-CoA thioesterase II [Ruania halotolerans]